MNRVCFIFLCFFYPSISFSIYNGDAINSKESSFVPKINISPDGKRRFACSGTLIRRNLILTSRHCVQEFLGGQEIHTIRRKTDYGDSAVFRFIFLNGQKDSMFIGKRYLNATFSLVGCEGKTVDWIARINPRVVYPILPAKTDLVILQIESMKDIPKCYRPKPIELAEEMPEEMPNEIYMMGWGWNGDRDKTFVRREGYNVSNITGWNGDRDKTFVRREGDNVSNITGGNDQPYLTFKGEHPTCAGDSGGPVFFSNDKSKLVGIIAGRDNEEDSEASSSCTELKEGEDNLVVSIPHLIRWLNEMKRVLPDP